MNRSENDKQTHGGSLNAGTSRRRLLKLGAASVPAALTLRGGAAWASSLTCQIELQPTGQVVFGRELKDGTYQPNNAELRYLSRLAEGDPGYSCLQSIGFVVDESFNQQGPNNGANGDNGDDGSDNNGNNNP